jgi:hypothetical protein
VPTFCRHNRFKANCPICSRDETPAQRSAKPRRRATKPSAPRAPRRGGDLRVRRLGHEADDGYRNPLVPGVKSSGAAARLADEIAFAAARLLALGASPPGLYAEVAGEPDIEEAAWLAFLIAYVSPLEDGDPFRSIASARTTWASGDFPDLGSVVAGPRSAHEPARGKRTLEAYRAWAARAGSQAGGLGGEPSWASQRRFARAYERLSLPGLTRDARYDFLVTLGRLGALDLRASDLALGGDEETTVAAKRVFGIGDKLLLERRAATLAEAAGVPLEALDLALFNWGATGQRATMGVPALDPPQGLRAAVGGALGA